MNDYQKYLGMVLKWLGRRLRSKQEVVQYLEKKHLSADLVSQIISYLEQHKLIDDAEFARWLVESRSRSSPRGKRLLEQELKSKGITDAADMPVLSDVDETGLAAKALEKKLRLWANLPERDRRQKSIRYLQSKGFSWSAIEAAIKKGYNTEDVN